MIYVEDERIKLNGVVLPGLVKSIEVTETAKVDEPEVEGSAVEPKQATGYEDAKVNIELIIDDTQTQTRFERYAVLRTLFRSPGQSVPQPIPIVSEDTAAHGIEKVIFKKLGHKGESRKSQLTANLELWEYIPQTIKAVSASSAAASQTSGSSQTASADTQGASSALDPDYQQYLETKRGKSPAVDDAGSAAAPVTVANMPFQEVLPWKQQSFTIRRSPPMQGRTALRRASRSRYILQNPPVLTGQRFALPGSTSRRSPLTAKRPAPLKWAITACRMRSSAVTLPKSMTAALTSTRSF